MLGIKQTDKRTLEYIYQQLETEAGSKKVDPLALQVQKRQLRYVGHCLRKPKNELIHKYVLYTPRKSHGERKKGRPQLQFAEYIGKLINRDIQLTVDEIRAMANDRKLWATKVVGVCKPKVFAVD